MWRLARIMGKKQNPLIFDKLPYFGNSQFRIAYSRVPRWKLQSVIMHHGTPWDRVHLHRILSPDNSSSSRGILAQGLVPSINVRAIFNSGSSTYKGRTTQSGFIIYHLSTVNEVGASLHPIDHNKPEGSILLSNDNILFLCCPGILINKKERNLRWTVIIFAVISPFFLRWQPPLLT